MANRPAGTAAAWGIVSLSRPKALEDEIGDPLGGLGAGLIRAKIDLDRHEQGDVIRPRIGTQIAVGLRLPDQVHEDVADRSAGGLDLSTLLDSGVQAGLDRSSQRTDPAVDARVQEPAQCQPGRALLATR